METGQQNPVNNDRAKENLQTLVNNNDLMQECCRFFAEVSNIEPCHAAGKLYDVKGDGYGCVTVISQDAVNIIQKEYLDDTQKKINYVLLSSFLEYRSFFKDMEAISYESWDEYLDLVMARHFLPLYKNGIKARLMPNPGLKDMVLPILVFLVYQDYSVY